MTIAHGMNRDLQTKALLDRKRRRNVQAAEILETGRLFVIILEYEQTALRTMGHTPTSSAGWKCELYWRGLCTDKNLAVKELSRTHAPSQACDGSPLLRLGARLRSSGLFTHGSGQNSECSGLATELAFGEVTFSSYVYH
jgi:hypothetical protein